MNWSPWFGSGGATSGWPGAALEVALRLFSRGQDGIGCSSCKGIACSGLFAWSLGADALPQAYKTTYANAFYVVRAVLGYGAETSSLNVEVDAQLETLDGWCVQVKGAVPVSRRRRVKSSIKFLLRSRG